MEKNEYNLKSSVDLKDILNTLLISKKTIIVITVLITISAGIYAFSKSPTYKTTVLVEVGHYKVLAKGDLSSIYGKTLLGSAKALSKKLNVLFIQIPHDRVSKITSIKDISFDKNDFLSIESIGISNEAASNELMRVVQYITNTHQKILNEINTQHEHELNTLNKKIYNISDVEIPLLINKINKKEKSLKKFQTMLTNINALINIPATEPAYVAIKLIEKQNVEISILKLEVQLIDLWKQKEDLESNLMNEYKYHKSMVESLMLPQNFVNSRIIGEIITSDFPISPNKRLIVLSAFFSSILLSILLILGRSAFKKVYKELDIN